MDGRSVVTLRRKPIRGSSDNIFSRFTGRNSPRRRHWRRGYSYLIGIAGASLTLFSFLVNISSLSKHVELSAMLQPPAVLSARDSRIEMEEIRTRKAEAPASQVPCQPMHEWQTQFYVNCNNLHEIDVQTEIESGAFTLLKCGGSRCAFKIGGTDTPLVLKLPKQRSDPETEEYERSRMDSMTMERLTKSPYVVSLYGYCGVSQVTEYASGGSLYDLIERFRGKQNHPPLRMSPIDKLRIAIQIITAVADLHSFESDGIASVTHNDLDPEQYVFVDGVYKLNDFHYSYFLEKNQYTDKVCENPMRINRRYLKYHAPEEGYRDTVDNEKADVYVAGSVMYYVLTSKWIFEGVNNEKGIRLQRLGKRSPFPLHIKNSTDAADQAMMKAITMLWTHDPKERPRARAISNFLIKELEKVADGDTIASDGIFRVVIPPFPNNWDFTEEGSSWEENLW